MKPSWKDKNATTWWAVIDSKKRNNGASMQGRTNGCGRVFSAFKSTGVFNISPGPSNTRLSYVRMNIVELSLQGNVFGTTLFGEFFFCSLLLIQRSQTGNEKVRTADFIANLIQIFATNQFHFLQPDIWCPAPKIIDACNKTCQSHLLNVEECHSPFISLLMT